MLLLLLPIAIYAAALPTVGGSSGTWGTELNEFLAVSLDSGGALNSNVVGSSQITDSAITSSDISDGTIGAADIATNAAIAFSQLAGLSSGNILVGSAGGVATSVSMSGDVAISNTGGTTIQSNAVALGDDTSGNYVATIADNGGSTITVANSGAENAAVTLGITADSVNGAQLTDSVVMDATQTFSSASTTAPTPDYNFILDGAGTGADYDSPHLIFRGNDGAANTELDISMFLDVTSTSDYKIGFYNDGASTEFGSIDESGNLQMDGDLIVSGGDITGADDESIDIGEATSNAITFIINSAAEAVIDATSFFPASSDGNALGTSSLMWSDLFLASGGVINFNNGDVTITHGSDSLTVAGGAAVFSGGISAAGATCTDNSGSAACDINDYAELYSASESVEQGSLVSIDDSKDDLYVKTTRKSYDPAVIGIVSTSPAMIIKGDQVQLMGNYTHNPLVPAIAMAGRVPVKVTNENGPIKPGDLLVPSSTPGYAMRCPGRLECIGSVVGKALRPFKEREGKVLALVMNG